jgi:hypothetical protein
MLLPRNPKRNYLCIQNIGTSDLSFGFNSAIISGTTLSPGSAGKQGGFFIWEHAVHTGSVYAFSASGTTCAVMEG